MYWMIIFLNTIWQSTHGEKKDPLDDPDIMRRFVQNLTGNAFEGDIDELCASLKSFRAELKTLVDDMEQGLYDSQKAISLLNGYISNATGHRRIEEHEEHGIKIRFLPERIDAPYVLSQLAMECYSLLFEMEHDRIRICENPTCRYYFYDSSKNKSKRHCASNCNNVMKAKRHREKMKATATPHD